MVDCSGTLFTIQALTLDLSIVKSLQGFLEDEFFLEALPGHLLPDQASQGRRSIILGRINQVVALGSG